MDPDDGRMRAEPFECMQYFYRRSHDPVIRCQAVLEGHVDVARLERAVDLSMPAAPLLSCAFDPDSHRWARTDVGADDIVRVVPCADEAAVASELLVAPRQDAGPRLVICVAQGAGRDTLCLAVDHMACDGAGFKEYLYLLSQLYSADDAVARAIVADVPLRRDLGQVTENLGVARKLSALASRAPSATPDPAMRLPLRGDGSRARVVRHTIGTEEFGRVRSRARSGGATVNDALLAAYARGLRKASGCPDVTFPCPVDLRRYGRPGQRFGLSNLTSNYLCNVTIGEGEGFDETLGKVAARMRAQKGSDACLKGPLLFHLLAKAMPFKTLERSFFHLAGVPVVSYTNLGILDERRLSFGDVGVEGAFLATAVKRPPSFQLSVSTFRGTCMLTSCLFASDADAELVGSFLGGVTRELVGFADG